MDVAGLEFRLLLVVDASPDESWSMRQLASADTRIAGLLLRETSDSTRRCSRAWRPRLPAGSW